MSLPTATKASETRSSTVWELYNEKAKIRDKALLKDWDSSINSLLLFAAIFAAVLTALCVESRKLLEPDLLLSIDRTLLYMAQQSNDPSTPPPSREPFVPPDWAVTVNGFFFTSLTTSILAAVGAVTCLQWVGEYDAGLEAASTPEHRALRWHYRYRATDQWYMRHMIASLAVILYVSVGFFLVGLSSWFWHLHPQLVAIPLTGLLIWATGYVSTTLMAVFHPAAPYRTAVSKALFRVLSLGAFYILQFIRMVIVLYRPLIKSVTNSFSRQNRYQDQFLLERIELSRQVKSALLKRYPWMPPGSDIHQSMHSYVWEQGCIACDDTIHLATLTWLANSTDLSEHSTTNFHLLLEELNQIPEDKLKEWPSYSHDAPWGSIFNLVVRPSSQVEGLNLILNRDRIIPTLAQLLQKMSAHPALFERTIQNLDNSLLTAFILQSASSPPKDAETARNRLESLTFLLASKKWVEMNTNDQPVMCVFKIIFDSLETMRQDMEDMDVATSWIFTLRQMENIQCANGGLMNWPNPELIRFVPDAFRNKDLREHALRHFLQLIDATFSVSEHPSNIRRRWRWNGSVESTSNERMVVIKLLVEHIIRIFLILDYDQLPSSSPGVFNDILCDNEIVNPALKLVISAFGGHQQSPDIPSEDDSIWHDEVWGYAVSVWLGFHSDYTLLHGHEVSSSAPLDQGVTMIARLRDSNLAAFDALIQLSTRNPSSSASKFWIGHLQSIQETDSESFRKASLHMIDLHPEQWLHTFVHFHSRETSGVSSPITNFMLRALGESLQSALIQLQWKKITRAARNQEPPVPPTPITRFAHVVNDFWQGETPYRNSVVPLPFAMLILIRDILRSDQSDSTSPTFNRLRACVSAVDELALAYASSGASRHQHYTQLFTEIVQALRPICERFIVQPDSEVPVGVGESALEDALGWPVDFQAALDHASHAGGIKRTDTSVSLKLVTAPGPSSGSVAIKNVSQSGTVRETFVRRRSTGMVPSAKSNDENV